MTKKQLAQKRNYFKYQLLGMIKYVDVSILTESEAFTWKHILDLRDNLVDNFDNNSREKGLNVPLNKCWCGKEGKYQLEEPLFDHRYWVCKKHKDNEN